MSYYIQRQQNQYGPYSLAELQTYLSQGSILWTDLGRTDAMTHWVPVSQLLNLVVPAVAVPSPALVAATGSAAAPVAAQAPQVYQQIPVAVVPAYAYPRPQKNKIAFVLLGIFLGALGIHNFYAGYTGKAVAQLLITVLTLGYGGIISWIWAIVEVCTVTQDSMGIPFIN
jgi:TM2 domain-containing membrane protein YozV